MDRDTAVSRIQQKLGFRSDLEDEIIAALQDVQDELERAQSLPWFLLEEDDTFTITPPDPAVATPLEVTLPTGFIKESDEQDGNLRYQSTTPGSSLFLQKKDLREAETYFFRPRRAVWDGQEVISTSDTTTWVPGVPIVYVLRKDVVRFYPGPDVGYDLLWTYYKADDRLDSGNVTNQWLTHAPGLLVGKAGMLIAGDTRDTDAMSVFMGITHGNPSLGIRGAEADFLALCYEREIAGRQYHVGGRL